MNVQAVVTPGTIVFRGAMLTTTVVAALRWTPPRLTFAEEYDRGR